LAGVEVVVHAASAAAKLPGSKAPTSKAPAGRLRREAASVKPLVYISIVGIDHIPYVYYKAKLAAEATIKAAAVP
jgi:hypothetical protein